MADLTPTDIVNKEFRRSLRGYTVDDVDEFLQQASDSLFRALEEMQRLRAQVESLTDQVKRYQQTEDLIKNALVLAERTADELRSHALQDADKIRRDAEEQLHAQRTEMDTMRQTRLRIISELRAVLNSHLTMLDTQESRLTSTLATADGEYR